MPRMILTASVACIRPMMPGQDAKHAAFRAARNQPGGGGSGYRQR